MFLLLVLILLPVLYYVYSQKNKRLADMLNKMPGPPTLPFLGTTKDLIRVPREGLFAFERMRIKTYGPLFRTWLGPMPQVHMIKPEHLELIMNNSVHINKATGYRMLVPWLGDGLLLAKGARWHKNRKLITPAFHFSILENFVEVFNEKSKRLVEILDKKCDGQTFDIYPNITLCALEIICETAMGVQVNAMEDKDNEYVRAIYDISSLIIQRLIKPWLILDFVYFRTKAGQRYKTCLEILHSFTKKVIKERRSKVPDNSETGKLVDIDDNFGKKKRLAFLDILLNASSKENYLSDDEIREEVDTFMFEGHDTTTAGICWTLFLLGNNLDIQERVRVELNDIFHDDNRNMTTRELGEMKYLERVIKEALRLYPSVPVFGRELTEDVKIGGYMVPRGTNVNLHVFDTHRDPELYPDPERFDPDRFLPENCIDRHPYAYVPFSAGPRNCIGQKFAMYEEKTILAYILRNFRVKAMQTIETVQPIMELIIRPKDGVPVVLERIRKP